MIFGAGITPNPTGPKNDKEKTIMLNTADIKQVKEALLPILEKMIFTQIKKKNTIVQPPDNSDPSLNALMLVIDQMDKRFDDVNKKFEAMQMQIDKRFDDVNKKFEAMQMQIDKRFDDVNKKFEAMQMQMDKRFDDVNKKFEAMQMQMDKRFDDVNKRFGQMQWFITASTGSILVLISIFKFLF